MNLNTYKVTVTVKAANADDARIIVIPETDLDLSQAGINEYEVVGVSVDVVNFC